MPYLLLLLTLENRKEILLFQGDLVKLYPGGTRRRNGAVAPRGSPVLYWDSGIAAGGDGMDAQTFWAVIGAYNQQTWAFQIPLLAFLLGMMVLSYTKKVPWAAKCALGILHLFIAAVFFAGFGELPIQRLFALPLFLACGLLFLYECRHNSADVLRPPTLPQALLLLLYFLYPLCSVLLGNTFPELVTHIMPCPAVSLGIALYSGYSRKNRLLLALLTLWGLTGVKSLLFRAYEDLILLLCGLYGLCLLAREFRKTDLNRRYGRRR